MLFLIYISFIIPLILLSFIVEIILWSLGVRSAPFPNFWWEEGDKYLINPATIKIKTELLANYIKTHQIELIQNYFGFENKPWTIWDSFDNRSHILHLAGAKHRWNRFSYAPHKYLSEKLMPIWSDLETYIYKIRNTSIPLEERKTFLFKQGIQYLMEHYPYLIDNDLIELSFFLDIMVRSI